MADGYAQATGRRAPVNLQAAAGTGNAMGNFINTQSDRLPAARGCTGSRRGSHAAAVHVPFVITSGQSRRPLRDRSAGRHALSFSAPISGL
jgi:hypothetical protein